MNRLLCGLALVTLAVATLFVADGFGGHVDLALPVSISGTVVDDATSRPIPGVWIVPVRSLEGSAAEESARARMEGLWTAFDTGYPLRGGALTAADGSFSFVFDVSWSQHVGILD